MTGWAVAGAHRMTAYDDFLAAMRRGFTPPKGAGRCARCAFHITTQGHRDGCPEDRRDR